VWSNSAINGDGAIMTSDLQQELERAVSAISQGRSILFVGSGFSKIARNYDGDELLLAGGLEDHFSSELKEDTGVALETISGQFLDERGPEVTCTGNFGPRIA
jgi:hypothetical protein